MTTIQNQMQRIRDITQKWFLSEPLLFAAWMTHRVIANTQIRTVRTGRGRVEFNEPFLASLDNRTLQEVMKFEALRIILKHPYERRKPSAEFAWDASNISIRECVPSALPMPTAESKFGTREHDRKHFEYYYNLLCGLDCPSQSSDEDAQDNCEGHGEESCNSLADADGDAECAGDCECCGNAQCTCEGSSPKPGTNGSAKNAGPPENAFANPPLGSPEFCRADVVGSQNAIEWDYDQFLCEQLNDVITEIESSNTWGTIPGNSQELILASRKPRLDYRRVLTAFRATVLSTSRRLTRMKPSRRYGFEYMGSRRDFTTNILFAVDVSGSVSTSDVQNAFSIVNRLFKYGIESIDVIWFDTNVRNEEPLTLRRARSELRVDGRGGTNFQPLMSYLDDHREYDGMIVFTDGIAPVPDPPKRNRRTRIVWLFNREENWESMHEELELPGMKSAFVLSD